MAAIKMGVREQRVSRKGPPALHSHLECAHGTTINQTMREQEVGTFYPGAHLNNKKQDRCVLNTDGESTTEQVELLGLLHNTFVGMQNISFTLWQIQTK